MWVWHLTKKFLRLFLLRALPDSIPYSKALLGFLTLLLFITKNILNIWFISIVKVYDKKLLIDLSLPSSMVIVAVYILLLFACVRSLLVYYNVPERSVQVITSFIAVDFLLTILFLVLLFCLSSIQLPLEPGSFNGLLIILFFVVLLYWQFMVYIHIIFNSLRITILKAGVLTLVYMLLQHNISEILMNILIVGESK